MNKLLPVFAGLVAGLSLLASPAVSFAEDGIYVGPSLSGYFKDSKRFVQNHDNSLVGGINLGYAFDSDWAVEANVGTDLYGHGMDQAQLNFYYMFGEDDGSWRPYVLAGISYLDQDNNTLAELRPDEDETRQAQVGLGLSNMLTEHWEFRGDLRLYHKVSDGQDGTNDSAVSLALNYFFDAAAPQAAPRVEAASEVQQASPAKSAIVAAEAEPEPEIRTITIRLNVEFEYDKAVVRAIYGDELQAVANAMSLHDDIQLVLEGHTDSRGDDDYNRDLSGRRAQAVKDKLVQTYGIAASRIAAVGYGETRPIDSNDTEQGRARNRRVVGELSYSEVAPE